ncbi:hypothetical protein ACWKSP_12520 [Micromonosporaceae bacterium Da 78-11]
MKAAVIGVFMLGLCLTLAGATSAPVVTSPAFLIAGMSKIPAPPAGSSWAPAPVDAGGLKMVASSDRQEFELHTAAGNRTFLPGVNLGSTTPGHQPGELSISAAQYRAWFAAMGWLGIRVVRIYTIHPPVFYQQLAAYNTTNPDRPLYLMQGVYLPDESYAEKKNLYDAQVTDAFRGELTDASDAVSGKLNRRAAPGRAAGNFDTDVTAWLIGWIIGVELDPTATKASNKKNKEAPAVNGKYFRSTDDASSTERWLAARMDELAGEEAKKGLSQPIAFVNRPTTDPLRHPEEPLKQEDLVQLDANHVLPTADWPAGTFASYHAYPYYPDFQRHEPALQNFQYNGRSDPYAGYLATLRNHHPDMPTLITEFGVPSAIGSAHNSPLGRTQGDHSEQGAMEIDAELLHLIQDQGLSAGFLFGWADDWFKFTWNTIEHQDPARRQLWHDPLTNEQYFGLLAMDAAGQPDAPTQYLVDEESAWPARRVTARVDESYLNLRVKLGGSRPGVLTVGFDVLPDLTGSPFPGTDDRKSDAAFALNLIDHAGQAYLRDQLDPMPLDFDVPASERGPAPTGWKPFQLIVDRSLTVPTTKEKLAIELQNAGLLRYGSWDPADPQADSRSLWHLDGDDLVLRVPWAMLGFADPSAHQVGVPEAGKDDDPATLRMQLSPGVTIMLAASGTVQTVDQVTWANWNRPYYTERLKQGAELFRDAALSVTNE